MTYSIIQPPFTLKFREMSTPELKAYATWFHQVAPERIAEVGRAVNATPGFELWQPNLTIESLESLGTWFEGQVETRKRTAHEVDETRAAAAPWIEVSEDTLTNRTFSLAMDIGMYFAEVVLKNLPGTYWDQPLKNKKFVDYGQPVLMGFGTVPLNPISVIIVTARRIRRKQPTSLGGLFATWSKMRK